MLSKEVKDCIDKSVLCWLATVDSDGNPNVSPKEIFTYHDDKLLIANIASPSSARNIKNQSNVCVGFIDILVQKGYQLKGTAELISSSDTNQKHIIDLLQDLAGPRFKVLSVFSISVTQVKPILAPSYVFYPETTTDEDQIKAAKERYGLE